MKSEKGCQSFLTQGMKGSWGAVTSRWMASLFEEQGCSFTQPCSLYTIKYAHIKHQWNGVVQIQVWIYGSTIISFNYGILFF